MARRCRRIVCRKRVRRLELAESSQTELVDLRNEAQALCERLRSMERLLEDAHVRVEAAEAFADVAEHHGEHVSASADAVLALREDPEPTPVVSVS